ncbi:hypothetical protein EMIT093MI4_150106 [Pseudomonas sp. IT-93MI4]
MRHTTDPLWERACSRMQCVIQHKFRLIRRIREQARSHRGECAIQDICDGIKKCPCSFEPGHFSLPR